MTDYRVGLTRDFVRDDGSLAFPDIGLDAFDANPHLTWEYLPEPAAELRREDADRFDALLVLQPKVSRDTVRGVERLKVVARFGVGYDNVDVVACTEAGVAVTITPDAVRRPVATAAIGYLLALSHRLLIKDRLTREGRWADRSNHMGIGLVGRTLGIVGYGNIGREIARLAAPFDLRIVASDPFVTSSPDSNVELVALDRLLADSDFVVVVCPLTPETHHLIGPAQLTMMKPSAFLINVARGPIVDQAALTAALHDGALLGAGLDVFETEPIAADDPLVAMDNVILTPHAVAWTDEIFRDNGRSAIRSIGALLSGQIPPYVINPEALKTARAEAWLAAAGAPR